jgi:hypothetical protein
MSKKVLISMLQQGKTGSEILSILDAIANDSVTEEIDDSQPTLEEIEF